MNFRDVIKKTITLWEKYNAPFGLVLSMFSPVLLSKLPVPGGTDFPFKSSSVVFSACGFICTLLILKNFKKTFVIISTLLFSGAASMYSYIYYYELYRYIVTPTNSEYAIEFIAFCAFYFFAYIFFAIIYLFGGNFVIEKLKDF